MFEHLLNQLAGRGVGAIQPKCRLPLESGVGHLAGLSHDLPADQLTGPGEHGFGTGHADMRRQGVLQLPESGFEFTL